MTKPQVAILTAALTSVFWMAVMVVAAAIAIVLYAANRSSGDEHSWKFEELPLVVALEVPTSCSVGDVVLLKGTVENPSEEPVMANSIDVYTSFLDGFEVVSVSPTPMGIENWSDDFRTFVFGHTIEPGGTFPFRFELQAKKAGRFEGDVDVCDENENFVSVEAATEVGSK